MPVLLVLAEEGLVLPHVRGRQVIGHNLLKSKEGTATVARHHREVLAIGLHAVPPTTALCIDAVHTLLPLYRNKLQLLVGVAVRRIPQKRILHAAESHVNGLAEVRPVYLAILHTRCRTAQLPYKVRLVALLVLVKVDPCVVHIVATGIQGIAAAYLTDNEIPADYRKVVDLVLLHILQAEVCTLAACTTLHEQRPVALHLEHERLVTVAQQLDNTLGLIHHVHKERLVVGTGSLPLQKFAGSA